MFVHSPPTGTRVSSIYREQYPFGPFQVGGVDHASNSIDLQVRESANARYRNLITVCRGSLRVLGPSSSEHSTSLVIALTPFIHELRALRHICGTHHLETPTVFFYSGVDQDSLLNSLRTMIMESEQFDGTTPSWEARRDQFLAGHRLFVPAGTEFGEISDVSLSDGYRKIKFSVGTESIDYRNFGTGNAIIGNFLDPVTLFHTLNTSEVSSGNPAITGTQGRNSWLEVSTRRILFTYRDEWNTAISDGTEVRRITDGTEHTDTLRTYMHGTIGVSSGDSFEISIRNKKLTRISGSQKGVDTLRLSSIRAPAHIIIGTINPSDWFHETHPGLSQSRYELPLYTSSNRVVTLVDGSEYYPSLYQDLLDVTDESHNILIAGWWVDHTFPIVPARPDSTLANLLTRADSHGATIRGLIWDMGGFRVAMLPGPAQLLPHPKNDAAVEFINSLSNGQAILDSRTHHSSNVLGPTIVSLVVSGSIPGASIYGLIRAAHVGSHHWKYILITNSRGTICYLGGMDINPNRLDTHDHHISASRYHDVQVKVQGPAVVDLMKSFIDRYNDHPLSTRLSLTPIPTIENDAHAFVQTCRTIGAGTQLYAPNGDRTIWATLRKAIRRARKYIYIEDQYLYMEELSIELERALHNIQHLVLIIDGSVDAGTGAFTNRARYLFLNRLRRDHASKVHTYTLANHGSTYKVHTKLAIVDDVFATVGSANMGVRSMTHDSEINVAVVDGDINNGAREYAFHLRVKLWAEHLRLHNRTWEYLVAKLGNVDRAVAVLQHDSRQSGSRLQPYDYNLEQGPDFLTGWFTYYEPDGSTPA